MPGASLSAPDDPTPGTLTPSSGNPKLAFFEPKAGKHKKRHGKRRRGGREGAEQARKRQAPGSGKAMRSRLAVPLAVALGLVMLTPSTAAAFDFLPGSAGFDVSAYGEGAQIAKQAGSHPVALTAAFNFQLEGGGPFTAGDLRDLSIELPPGLIENPTAVGECSQAEFHTPRSSPFEESLSGESCRDRSQVGIATVRSSFGGGTTRTFGIFNLEPPPGAPSELGFNPYGAPIVLRPVDPPGRRGIRNHPAGEGRVSAGRHLRPHADDLGGPLGAPPR